MSTIHKDATDTAIRQVIANIRSKFAELDAIDSEFADLDAEMPMGEGVEQFNLLSDKRDELEKEIRSMRERVQLISEWEKFKSTGWSDDIQIELSSLDQQFSDIADGATDEPMGMGAPMIPDAPIAPDAPIDPAMPPAPDVPVEEPLSEPVAEDQFATPPAEPLAPPMASIKNATNKNSNYELQDKGLKTSDLKKGDTHMANQTPTKPSLKEKLAEVKSKREAISKDAKIRVASAWTIAKTMLPSAPAEVQKSFAASLLNNTTKVLTAALRQTAVNSQYTKIAETLREVHKVEMNDLLEGPEVLKAEKSAVGKELKGDPKSAGKVADDRKEAGPQPDKYDDGRDGSEPKELDASKASDRPDVGEKPGQTQNLSDGKNASAGESKEVIKLRKELAEAIKKDKSAASKVACSGKDCTGCTNANCTGKKGASSKKADGEPPVEAPAAPESSSAAPTAPEEEEAPLDAPSDLPPAVPENPEAEAAEILTEDKKQILEEKIDEIANAIQAIEGDILEEEKEEPGYAQIEEGEGDEASEEFNFSELEGGDEFGAPEGEEELDFSKVFNPESMEEKVSSLANEGEDKFAGEEDDFFHPSSNLEASMEDDGMNDMHDMFSRQGSDGDPLAALIAGLKTAEQVAGMEIVESFSEAANHFESDVDSSDDRDNETDHKDDLWADTIGDITPEEQGAKRVPQDSTNRLEKPKAAVLKKINLASGADKTHRFDIGAALFGVDED